MHCLVLTPMVLNISKSKYSKFSLRKIRKTIRKIMVVNFDGNAQMSTDQVDPPVGSGQIFLNYGWSGRVEDSRNLFLHAGKFMRCDTNLSM